MFVKEENHFSLLARKNGKERVEKEGPGGVRNGKAGKRERCLILRVFFFLFFFFTYRKFSKKWERNEKPLIGG